MMKLILASLSLVLFPLASAHAEVLLEARAKVYSWPGQELLFQDLLRDNEAKTGLDAETLNRVVIASDKVTEKPLTLTSTEVSRLLRSALRGQKARHLQFRLPEEIRIEPHTQKFLESRLTSDLTRSFQKKCECRLELSRLQVQWPENISPQTTWSWEALPEVSSLRGSLFLGVDFQVGAHQHRRWVQAQARVFREVPVATRPISYGEAFTKDNVRLDWRDVSYSQVESLPPDELMGFASNRMIPLGQVVQRRDMVKPKIVKYGDAVKVYRKTGALEIETTGVAQQAGAVGDSIKVKVLQTNKLISAQIEERGKVRIQ